ncbi:MAG TPA: hypothetical protein DDW94_10520 [Deltaproteobacteria bacterium]|nr:MAG: hypothetical protein A2Z79_11855 [Deltaproteobacteria bacterium GWA2_55_82]OGQ63561.1 MAG: hypothetical protein A3I81_06045 [Deltaproteobacteria bacterium RIFCSPLOWO2_02_FULL_55_12]OIJ74942.1 MAG: hypothetical protein A2V21_312100 [Deltaproteobacteria bacterium GWC2_55_46]HBG47403.1 hypothetical protein [Deltaproteobacteria bacterium]HCY11419.1 hypothetical protein [Deltaproteobacteria bacterium]
MKRHIIFNVLLAALFALLSSADVQGEGLADEASRHSIKVSVDIASGTIEGTDNITLGRDASEVRLLLRSGSETLRAEADGVGLKTEVKKIDNGLNEITIKMPRAGKRLSIGFRGKFQTPREAAEGFKRGVAYVNDGVIGEEGVYLPSSATWFPQEEGSLVIFEAEVTLPAGYSSVMEGDLASSVTKGSIVVETWKEWRPVDGVDLIAGRYFVEKESYKGIDIYTFFFQKDEPLSRTYIEKSKGHLDAFQSIIGPYPFKKFAVVENFMPTGYGMPSFTLLGSSVIRLPFIPDISLGHEIAHNWLGNSVFIDSSLGNWAEALTTFIADYRFDAEKGPVKAREFMAAKLRGYKNFTKDGGEIALKDFTDATSTASRAVGYNKGVMVFNMLERTIGKEQFGEGLRRFYSENTFKRASWADIRRAFEGATGRDLGWFFVQWLDRVGGPRLTLEKARSEKTDKGYAVTLALRQSSPAYVIDLPVLVKTASGETWKTFRMKDEAQEFTVDLEAAPLSIEVDPDYRIFRVLSDEEIPPTLAGLLGDKEAVIVLPNSSKPYDKYLRAADLVSKDFELEITTDAEIGRKDYLKDHSLFILGGPGENRLYWLTGQYFSRQARITGSSFEIGGKTFPSEGSTLVLAVKNPHDPSKTLALMTGGSDRDAMMEAARRVRYFTDFSYLVFTDGRVEKGLFEGKRTLKHVF